MPNELLLTRSSTQVVHWLYDGMRVKPICTCIYLNNRLLFSFQYDTTCKETACTVMCSHRIKFKHGATSADRHHSSLDARPFSSFPLIS